MTFFKLHMFARIRCSEKICLEDNGIKIVIFMGLTNFHMLTLAVYKINIEPRWAIAWLVVSRKRFYSCSIIIAHVFSFSVGSAYVRIKCWLHEYLQDYDPFISRLFLSSLKFLKVKQQGNVLTLAVDLSLTSITRMNVLIPRSCDRSLKGCRRPWMALKIIINYFGGRQWCFQYRIIHWFIQYSNTEHILNAVHSVE